MKGRPIILLPVVVVAAAFGPVLSMARGAACDTWPRPSPVCLAVLIAAGVTQSVAQELAATCNPAAVTGWCEYVRCARGIKSPAGLIVARLKAGDPPPAGKGRKGKGKAMTGADYIGGEFADLIEY